MSFRDMKHRHDIYSHVGHESNFGNGYFSGGGGGGDRVPSCRHRAGGVGQFLAGMQFSTKMRGHLLKFLETS